MREFAPYLITALIYVLVAADFWRNTAKPASGKSLRWHAVMIAVGLVLHGWLLYQSLFSGGLNLGFANALSAILWLTVLIYWLTDFKHHLYSLQAFVLPPAAFFVLLQKLMPESHVLPYAD
ncbi:MAG TPA: cytochrome C biogenesis protein, partial [Methylophilaceae bacterium]|nr:cytochrome C biogenesis protein [Methylophilaceae bacterium]